MLRVAYAIQYSNIHMQPFLELTPTSPLFEIEIKCRSV